LRDGAHHSGNWGGLIRDPGIILSHAIASLTDARGQIAVPEWRPTSLTPEIRELLADVQVSGGDGSPDIDADWGEAELSPEERVYGWNSFAVLALELGNPERPQNAIAPEARAVCQIRYVVGTDPDDILPALRRHLDAHGFHDINVTPTRMAGMRATRSDPDNEWVQRALASVNETLEKNGGGTAALIPNIGGGIPNDIFAEDLGMPTVWIPHSYAGCNQHAPNEHMLASVAREGLQIMAGLFWDIGAD
jgi:acetylornithine deacetylase/succinyl-diaminopimelate desuccinylase-like protein